MRRREVAFFLIGLGAGLTLAPLAVVIFLHHMFIIGFQWTPGSLVLTLPFLLLLVGVILVFRPPRPGGSD